MTGTMDTSRAVAALNGLADALGTDARELVQDESRRLIRTIANITPPGKGGGVRRLGEQAVERQLSNLFSEARPPLIDEIGSKYGIKDISTAYIVEKTGERLQLDWKQLDPTGDRMEQIHKANRDASGRVKLIRQNNKAVWSSRAVVPAGTRAQYIAKVKLRVGRAKAKWASIGAKLGDNFPNWISRHFGNVGNDSKANLSGLTDKEKPSITFGTVDGTNARIRSLVKAALDVRVKAMLNRTRLVLSGYKQDVARSIRPRAHAKETATVSQQEGVE
jgi:hypothetical protein